MIRITYNRFDKLYRDEHDVEYYQTSRVSYVYPKHIEKVYRYLKMWYPDVHRKILGWSPIWTPSFGRWLEFPSTNLVIYKTKMTHNRSKDDVYIMMDMSTKRNFKESMSTIVKYVTDFDVKE